jgi:L-aspartate oxidase
MASNDFDLLIIGTGISGLSCAIRAAESGLRVCVLSKESKLSECNTNYAQGGIVSYGIGGDSPEKLSEDIIQAGDFLNSREAVSIVSGEGPAAVDSFLMDKLGVPFDRAPDGSVDRTQEAAHSLRRIYHVKDTTGNAIETAMLAYAAKCPNLELRSSRIAVDVITNTHHSTDNQQRYKKPRALGVYVLDENSGEVEAYFAPATVLATGGVGNLFLHTSNPDRKSVV